MELLHRRFPSLEPDYEDRIKNANTEDLLHGVKNSDAKSMEEVFEN